jgi:hypothetical protein
MILVVVVVVVVVLEEEESAESKGRGEDDTQVMVVVGKQVVMAALLLSTIPSAFVIGEQAPQNINSFSADVEAFGNGICFIICLRMGMIFRVIVDDVDLDKGW